MTDRPIVVKWDYAPIKGHSNSAPAPFDEIIAWNASVHIERMNNTQIRARIESSDGQAYVIAFWTDRANIYCGAEDDSDLDKLANAEPARD